MAQRVHDLVVRGGLVADGRGGEPRVADVAVEDPANPVNSGAPMDSLVQP